jgi:DNA-directed RNA polymerase specialized sigma subunit
MAENRPSTPVEFKRECRKYFYYIADIKTRMEEIRQVDYKMAGVHSIDFERVRTRTHGNQDARLVAYIELSTELNRQLQEVEEKVLRIINTIGRIPDPSFRPIVWMLYVQGMRVSEVAAIYDISKDYLSQLINDEIHKLFPKETRKKKTESAE